jgi:hypothetical protein
MQYKVSKNFKIETRFNVSQGGRYPGFWWRLESWILNVEFWIKKRIKC